MATYNANISVKVTGLTTLKNLEDRVSELQKRFTKVNAAAANITAPFQGHIKALKEVNTLLKANNDLLTKQYRMTAAMARSRGPGSTGAGMEPAVQKEVSEQLMRQVNLLKARAQAVGGNSAAMDKLRSATNEIAGGSARQLQLARALLRNANQLVRAEETRVKAIEDASARELRTKQYIWRQQAKALADQERLEIRLANLKISEAKRAAREQEAADKFTAQRREEVFKRARAAGGSALGTIGTAVTGGGGFMGAITRGGLAAGGFGAAKGAGAVIAGAAAGQMAQQASLMNLAQGMGPLKGVVEGLAGAVPQVNPQLAEMAAKMSSLGVGAGAAAVAVAALMPFFPQIARTTVSAAKGAAQLAQALEDKAFGSVEMELKATNLQLEILERNLKASAAARKGTGFTSFSAGIEDSIGIEKAKRRNLDRRMRGYQSTELTSTLALPSSEMLGAADRGIKQLVMSEQELAAAVAVTARNQDLAAAGVERRAKKLQARQAYLDEARSPSRMENAYGGRLAGPGNDAGEREYLNRKKFNALAEAVEEGWNKKLNTIKTRRVAAEYRIEQRRLAQLAETKRKEDAIEQAAIDKKRQARRDTVYGLRTGVGAGFSLANIPGQSIFQAISIGGAVGGAAGAAAGAISGTAVALGQLLVKSTEVAKVFETTQLRLKALSDGYDSFSQVAGAAANSGAKFGLSQTEASEAFANSYARLRPLGLTLGEVTTVFEGFNTAVKLSGSSTAEAQGAYVQLVQAIGAGALRGQELNSVLEQAPILAQAIAKELKTTVGQLKSFGEDGKISSEVVVKALDRVRREGAEKLAKSLETPAQKVKDLQNAFERLQIALGKLSLPGVITLLGRMTEKLDSAVQFVENFGLAWEFVSTKLDPVVQGFERLLWIFTNLTPPGWAMQMINGSAERGVGVVNNLADRRRREVQGSAYGLLSGGRYIPGTQQTPFATTQTLSLSQRLGTGGGSGGGSTTKGDKAVEEAVRRGVIGGITGGGQGDASRGRSSGPHLHSQALGGLSESQHRSLVDRALDFGGGRTASSFGLSRGHAGHGYAGLDYLTPQGTPFTLRPGYTSTDLGIRGALGRGMRISGPGGSFELGHLAGVKTGDLNGKGAAGDLLDAQQDALNAQRESLLAGQKLSQEFTRQVQLRMASTDLERQILQIQFDYADRAEQIKEIQDAGQRAELESLNTKILELETLKAQLDVIYERAGIERQITDEYGKRAFGNGGMGGNFRTDIDLDPNKTQSKVQDYMDQLQSELADTQAQIVSLSQTIEGEIGSAMSSAVVDVINGTGTVADAFGQMFANIGKAFIDMATQMLAKQAVLSILQMIGGGLLGGIGGGFGATNYSSSFGGGGGFSQGFSMPSFLASGGPMAAGKPYIVGEQGPELILPSQGGYVLNADETQQALADARGAFSDNRSALNSISSTSREQRTEKWLSSGASSTEIRYSRVGSGDLPFVTEEDMLQAARTAAQEGARMGQQRTMAALKNNPGARRTVGI